MGFLWVGQGKWRKLGIGDGRVREWGVGKLDLEANQDENICREVCGIAFPRLKYLSLKLNRIACL